MLKLISRQIIANESIRWSYYNYYMLPNIRELDDKKGKMLTPEMMT